LSNAGCFSPKPNIRSASITAISIKPNIGKP
jgi:hypothetical protein